MSGDLVLALVDEAARAAPTFSRRGLAPKLLKGDGADSGN